MTRLRIRCRTTPPVRRNPVTGTTVGVGGVAIGRLPDWTDVDAYIVSEPAKAVVTFNNVDMDVEAAATFVCSACGRPADGVGAQLAADHVCKTG